MGNVFEICFVPENLGHINSTYPVHHICIHICICSTCAVCAVHMYVQMCVHICMCEHVQKKAYHTISPGMFLNRRAVWN